MNIWIDAATPPQVTFFRPVVRELQIRGHNVLITAWDRGQTASLARRAWPDVTLIGAAGFRRPIFDKATSVFQRARTLAEFVRARQPTAAVSHNSYAQLIAARLLRVRAVTVMDYEHQPANHVAFRLAHAVVVPDAIPLRAIRRFGATATKTVRYPGVKEEVTLVAFCPDPAFRANLGIGSQEVVVSARPPAEGATYHRHRNETFDEALSRYADRGISVIVTPRTASQAEQYRGAPRIRVLSDTVSGPDLLYWSDAFIGGGGTMTREAAVLGTPAFSLFTGRPAAVDAALARQGRLTIVGPSDPLPESIEARPRPAWTPDPAPVRRMVDLIVELASR